MKNKQKLIIFALSIIVALTATISIGQRFQEPTSQPYETYKSFIDTPVSKISARDIRNTLGNPVTTEYQFEDGVTYYEYTSPDVPYRQRVWTDTNGKILAILLQIPSSQQEDQDAVLQKYESDNLNHFSYMREYGNVTNVAYPLEGKTYIIDQKTQKVVAVRLYDAMELEAYQQIFVQQGEGDTDTY
ncbi:hypothetical protein KC571_01645 [candidate division WWE3 bacterium]|uniref:Outer membrane protein assembly factor BamE n=1 Tax=candidate division WWE3 bacterium TaxID=2053526 RepID=A0A955LHX6_UNCKA|nr:hypothetical protein [candidate division WWE3 bacterium]